MRRRDFCSADVHVARVNVLLVCRWAVDVNIGAAVNVSMGHTLQHTATHKL